MTIRLQEAAFDPWQEVASYGAAHSGQLGGRSGATAVFVGTMRDINAGESVSAMTLEHYPGMTERHLEKIASEVRVRWPILDCLIIHRHGLLVPNEPIVLVAVWSEHRDAAFAACRYLIDELKTRAPFWKHEKTAAGARWVEPS